MHGRQIGKLPFFKEEECSDLEWESSDSQGGMIETLMAIHHKNMFPIQVDGEESDVYSCLGGG